MLGDTKESKLFTTQPPALSASIVSGDVFLVTVSTVTVQILDKISKVLVCLHLLAGRVFMVALWNRADHYIFILFLLLSFFSSPNLSGRTLDVYHTSTHGVALVQI